MRKMHLAISIGPIGPPGCNCNQGACSPNEVGDGYASLQVMRTQNRHT